jgi:hypothetical protein
VKVLLLLLDDVAPERLRAAVPDGARVHVVAPAHVGVLDWLATAEDDAARRAEVRALSAEWTLAGAAEVEGDAGEADPLQAVEDVLRRFAADEIVVVGDDVDPDLAPALQRFGLPVTTLARGTRRRSFAYRYLRRLAAGQRDDVPFVLFFGVNAALVVLGIVLSLIALLILWLAT